ncbi:gfo/Idh/MocA family oxidoreductase [Lactococcus lactis subsp. lactis KLDS 4.0325]|uniref:Gfo/Idh/MocA family oxidoreductase n=2 Tax=Lactococcus TaxID=1357 RepID=T0SH34_LACLC|nr:Gfo/Idh/MocA family oxidoreductase [Lactococcus lactis]AGY45537.1 gfo/Idh/MocA family oxidoreductase [Lactococcus lactis subsp. lactis KLDS 4.0325]EQC58242.1 hypothetical protein LLT6_09875 [Lactococcus cremoris subsp. cremoris TIFN6]TRW69669.1 Gfo/Idh/MocA family oxidoreductase [Lactococcus lactis]
MKKVVIIGCGAVGYRWYFDGIKKSKYCEVAALVDIDEEALEKAGKYLHNDNLYSSLEEFLSSKCKADIALILTQHSSHFRLIEQCLNNGLHVYSEKPFAETKREAQYLLKVAHDKGKFLASAPQIKLSSRNQKVKEIIESGVLGKIALIRASGSNMGPADRKDTDYNPKWFYNDGGSLASLGIYTLSIIIFLFGIPDRVASYSGIAFSNRTVKYGPNSGEKFKVTAPDNQIAILDYENGMYVMFDGSYVVKHPVDYELIIHGELGTLLVGGFGGPDSIILENEHGKQKVGPDDSCHLEWNLFWGVDNLAKCIQQESELIVSGEFAKNVIEVMEAMKYSNKENIIVRLGENER